MKKTTVLTAAGCILIALGAVLMAPIVYFSYQNKAVAKSPVAASVQTYQLPSKPTIIKGKPNRLVIPSIQLDIEVVDGIYDTKTASWSLSLSKAHFALISTEPNNEAGNTLIYGHYRPEVFANMRKVQPNAEAFVYTDNGYKFSYTFGSSVAAKPSDTSIFGYEGSPQLTIQTCSGTYMQNRQLYTFTYSGYSKN